MVSAFFSCKFIIACRSLKVALLRSHLGRSRQKKEAIDYQKEKGGVLPCRILAEVPQRWRHLPFVFPIASPGRGSSSLNPNTTTRTIFEDQRALAEEQRQRPPTRDLRESLYTMSLILVRLSERDGCQLLSFCYLYPVMLVLSQHAKLQIRRETVVSR